jgi:hypothetical protein
VTRRAANQRKLMVAAAAAGVTDAWLGERIRASAFSGLVGRPDEGRLQSILAKHPRVRRKLPNRLAPLFEAFSAYPKLAPWLQSPARFQQFVRFTGAALEGGRLTRMVSRAEVSSLIAALGEDVWRFGVRHGAADARTSDGIDAVIAAIEVEGGKAVFAFFDRVAPGCAIEAFSAADVPLPPASTSVDGQTAKTAVLAVMERAGP